MGSLAHCMKLHKVDDATAALLRAKVTTLKDDGYTHSEASVQAVQDHIDEMAAQRADVLAQMSAQGPVAKKEPQVQVDEGTLAKDLSAHDFGDLTPEQEQALKNTGGIVPKQTLGDRYAALRQNIGLRLEQGIVDQFAPLKELDWKAYLLARLSKASDGALEAIMNYGNLSLIDGVTDSDARGIGFIDVLKQLKGEHHRFMWWVAAHRAEQLTVEQRENLFGARDIAALKTLAANDAKFPDRTQKYMKVLGEYNAISRNVLDIAEQSGIINTESRSMWEKEFYVPFYRALEDEVSSPNIARSSGLVRQYAFKKLKGGKEKLQQDLLANVMMNWSHLLSASAKNRAATAALEAAETMGVAVKYPYGQAAPKGSVWYLKNGEKQEYEVMDPFTLDAITSLEAGIVGGYAGKTLAKMKNMITIGVTANPAFKIRNLMRDSLSAIAQSELSLNVPGNIVGGIKSTANKKSQAYASMLAGGGLIRFGTMLEGNRSSHVSKLINSGVKASTILDTKEKMLDMVQVAWDHYNELGDVSEGANRISLYKQLRAKGKSHAEASLAARDLLDFSKGGSWGAIRFLVQTVPFMNARVQGLYRLGQGVKAHPARFATVLTATALASIALMLTYSDDDDWKKREEFDRDNYWWFKVGDVAYRIPKPFEVGVLATLAERGLEMFIDDEMTAKRFRERVSFAVWNTFAMNPSPQLFKPMIDVYSNVDSFTGRQIESAGSEKLPKEFRAGPRTSEAAKAAATVLPGLSPYQIDHLVKGYFGWLGTSALVATDAMTKPFLDRPEAPSKLLRDTFLIGNFMEELPANQSRYVTQFYKQAKEVNEAYAQHRALIAAGDKPGAKEYDAENRALIAAEPKIAAYQRQLSEISAATRKVEASLSMGPDTKRTKLNLLLARRNAIAQKASRVTEAATQ